jgi:hypothetical protein
VAIALLGQRDCDDPQIGVKHKARDTHTKVHNPICTDRVDTVTGRKSAPASPGNADRAAHAR